MNFSNMVFNALWWSHSISLRFVSVLFCFKWPWFNLLFRMNIVWSTRLFTTICKLRQRMFTIINDHFWQQEYTCIWKWCAMTLFFNVCLLLFIFCFCQFQYCVFVVFLCWWWWYWIWWWWWWGWCWWSAMTFNSYIFFFIQ